MLTLDHTERALHASPPHPYARTSPAPDVFSATDGYAERFSGPVGRYLLEVQTRIVERILAEVPRTARVLDIGGGHGQLATPLTKQGFRVTVLGSETSCRQRLDRLVGANQYDFQVGNLEQLPLPDNSYDVVLAFRLLSHLHQPEAFLAEACRVSRGCVLFDYAELLSVNRFSGPLFALKKRIEKNTRTFRCFRQRDLVAELQKHQFTEVRCYRQFLFPMALHRLLAQPRLSRLCESFAHATGLTAVWGSPVIVHGRTPAGGNHVTK